MSTENFADILDKAIEELKNGKTIPDVLDMFPEQKLELTEILPTALELQNSAPAPSKHALHNTLERIPVTKDNAIRYNKQGGSLFFNFFGMKLLSTLGVLVLLVVVSGGTYVFTKKSFTGEISEGNSGKIEHSASKAASLSDQLAAQSKIVKFTSLDEVKDFLENNSGSDRDYYSGIRSLAPAIEGFGGEMVLGLEAMEDSISLAMPTDGIALGSSKTELGSSDYSKTNVQVEGVDEADIIKTDGKYIYVVSRNNIFIVDAHPADNANVLSKINLEVEPQNIYVNGDRLVVFGNDNQFRNTSLYKTFRRRSNYSFFKVYDISNREDPKLIRDLNFEGNYSNSRMIGDHVYFITQNYHSYYVDEMPLPRIIEDGNRIISACSDEEVGCDIPDIYYFDMPYDSYNFTSVNSIDITDDDKEINSEIYLLSGNQNMYVSKDNIYITYTKYVSEYHLMMEVIKELVYPKLPLRDVERIAAIESTENFILSQNEKMDKIGFIFERYTESLTYEEQDLLEEQLERAMEQKYKDISKELEKTVIHKIAVKKGELEYKTFGEVTGHVLNQFSMDEDGDYFRIATTKNRTWSQFDSGDRESYNNLYVLDKNLEIVGTLEGLAEGEQIKSVRFMQNRAYMVTFRQVDPLFVIDLADPKNPSVLGKLKIPGWSDYLHPYDDTTLIGLGRDAEATEWGGVRAQGVKLSLFDVSDVSNPKEIDVAILGDSGSDSIALQDHKAFLFSREKNLLAIPVSIMEREGEFGYNKFTFSGVAVFDVDKSGFTLRGKIDHSDGGKDAEQEYWRGHNYYDNTVKRSLYIDDVLYTYSNKYLKMNNLDQLNLVKNLELKKPTNEIDEPDRDPELPTISARDNKRLSDIKQMQTALELYYTDNNAYPLTSESSGLGIGPYSCIGADGFDVAGCINPYMARVPRNPSPNGEEYMYKSEDGTTYSITFKLEEKNGGLGAGEHAAKPSGIE